MNLEQAKLMSLAELKNVAEQIDADVKGIKAKDKILDVIIDKCDELGINIPEPTVFEEPIGTPLGSEVKAEKEMRIQDYPRRKVIVEARDPEVREQPFGINAYSALVVMGEQVMLPEPVISFIKSLTDVKHDVDKDGNSVHREVKRFMVSYED